MAGPALKRDDDWLLAGTPERLDELTALQSVADETEPLGTEIDAGPVGRA